MGRQREPDAEYFYDLDELCALTGYEPNRVNEIAKRYGKRLRPDGKKKRLYYLKKARIFNVMFADWLLEGRFRAPVEVVLPKNAVSLKKAAWMGSGNGLTYKAIWKMVWSGKLRSCVYRGRYYIDREEAEALSERYRRRQAPDNWFPVVALIDLCKHARSPRAVYAWVKRRTTMGYLHPKGGRLVQFVPIGDALTYLTRVLGGAHKAFSALAKYASKYFRSLRKVTVDLFGTDYPPVPDDFTTLGVVFTTGASHPPPLNHSQLGHGLLSLRT